VTLALGAPGAHTWGMATDHLQYEITPNLDRAQAAAAFDRLGAQIEALRACVEDWRIALVADPEPAPPRGWDRIEGDGQWHEVTQTNWEA